MARPAWPAPTTTAAIFSPTDLSFTLEAYDSSIGDVFEKDWDPYDGFNRASIVRASRQPYKPKITADDLLTPRGLGNARMAGMCLVMAICATLLYIWPVVFVVNLAYPLGHVFDVVLLAAILTFSLFLYFAGARETRRDREYAARM